MKIIRLCALSFALLIAVPLAAQETKAPEMTAEQQAMMEAWQKAATPGAQHAQLVEQFVGRWDTMQTMWMDETTPPSTETGKAVGTVVLGGRQVRTDYSGQFMGQPFEGVGLGGYDNVTGKYVNHWMDNMSTGVYRSEGEYDAATRTYTYRGQMPDPMKPATSVPVREVVRIVDQDHHVMEMYETRDGKERKTFQIEFARAK